jgi:hypothetical protein
MDYRKKAENKEGKRWTLKEWMEQKERNYMMDLWLGMYAPSPFEFFVGASQNSYNRETSTQPPTTPTTQSSNQSFQGSLGAYALIVGLQGEYENNWEEQYDELSGSLNLRLLGNAKQGTHLIVQVGQRTRNLHNYSSSIKLSHIFTGAELDLYLMKYFGIHGLYRSFNPITDATLGEVSGTRSEAGVFIDFNALRVYGNWYSDVQQNSLSGTVTKIDRTGIMSGIKFFF